MKQKKKWKCIIFKDHRAQHMKKEAKQVKHQGVISNWLKKKTQLNKMPINSKSRYIQMKKKMSFTKKLIIMRLWHWVMDNSSLYNQCPKICKGTLILFNLHLKNFCMMKKLQNTSKLKNFRKFIEHHSDWHTT